MNLLQSKKTYLNTAVIFFFFLQAQSIFPFPNRKPLIILSYSRKNKSYHVSCLCITGNCFFSTNKKLCISSCWGKISHDQVCIVDLLRLFSKKGPARSNYLLYIPILISFITIWSLGIEQQALSTYWPYWIFFSPSGKKNQFSHTEIQDNWLGN